ncbi:MAG TPA: hypothetical protein VNZ05_00125 [Solirubrobacteraceae bacterium]|nr:hypothetical protein [Solirubrobacteraceae bacterium]
MTSHNKRTRGRSRKRRSSGAPVGAAARAPGGDANAAPAASAGKPRSGGSRAGSSAPAKRTRARSAPRRGRGGGLADLLPVGKRPPAPWSPLPLSELLILIGAIGTIVGLSRGASNGLPPLIAGLAAVAIGTVEVTLREHLSGYRSHTIVLAMLPVVVLDSAVVLLVAPFGTGLKLGLLAVDVAIVAALYKLLRARFLDARRERVFSEGR